MERFIEVASSQNYKVEFKRFNEIHEAIEYIYTINAPFERGLDFAGVKYNIEHTTIGCYSWPKIIVDQTTGEVLACYDLYEKRLITSTSDFKAWERCDIKEERTVKAAKVKLKAAGHSIEAEDAPYNRPEYLEAVNIEVMDDRIIYTQYWNVLSTTIIYDWDLNFICDYDPDDMRWYTKDFSDLDAFDINPSEFLHHQFLRTTISSCDADNAPKIGEEFRVGPLTGPCVKKEKIEGGIAVYMKVTGNFRLEK